MRDMYLMLAVGTVAIGLYHIAHEWSGRNCLAENPGVELNSTYLKPRHPNTIPMYIEHSMGVVLVALVVYYYGHHRIRRSFYTIAYYLIGACLGNGIMGLIKKATCSPRPYAGRFVNEQNSFMSTPSGHTFYATFGTLYVSYYIWLVCKNKHITALAWLLLAIFPVSVGISRIADNHHFPVDVLCGVVLACGIYEFVIKLHFLAVVKKVHN